VAARLAESHKAFEELVACRETLAQQVKALGEHRAAVAARLGENSSLLRRVLATGAAKESPDAVERDAAVALRRVRADEVELAKCDEELRRLTDALERLDRDVDEARLALQQRVDELGRRRAGAAGGRAYRGGSELATQIVPPGR
jgi:hypothetical protein